MESKTSAANCEIPKGSPYHIYGVGEEENIYETIKIRKQPLPEVYDEVFLSKPSHKEFESQPVYNVNCGEELLSTYGEFQDRKFTNIIRNWYKVIPLWVKIAVPIILIFVAVGYNGMLVLELEFLAKVNKSTTLNTSISPSTLFTTTTAKTYSSTFSKVATTVPEEVTTAKTTWDYTNKSWYIKSDSPNTYYCETWELVSTVKFQPLDLQGSICYDIPDCLKFIDLYKHNSDEKANYTFYIDQYGNIYEGRDWYCPYVSGELWVALITSSFNIFRPKSELQLRHFYEMVSYRRAFEYFHENVEEEFVYKCSLASHESSSCVDG